MSHSMKNLEEEAGCQAGNKAKKVTLTEAGDRLLDFVRPFLDEMEKVRNELDGFEKFGTGRIRRKCCPKLVAFFYRPSLRSLMKRNRFAGSRLSVRTHPGV